MRTSSFMTGLFAALVLVVVLGVAAPSARAAGAVLTIDVAKLTAEQLGPDSWGEPIRIGDKDCRLAKSGKDAWLRAPAWWKDGLRPAEGQYYLAEIVYQDTAGKPILFNVWAGFGGNESRSEMHRFGGLKDGKWKTVAVPLGWDVLMVRPGTRLVEFSIDSKDGDVAVASIRVVPLASKDLAKAAEQWNADTRAWVQQVQQRHEGKERKELEKAQKPVEAAIQGDAAVVPYVRSYMNTVYPYSAPQAGEGGAPLKAEMAQNEYEPAALGVYAPKSDLTNVTVKVEGLHQENGKGLLNGEVRTAEYALVQNGAGLAAFPQRLWPMYATSIKKGQSGWFWVTFQSDPKTTPAGLYRGKAIVSSDQGQATVDVQVRVLPIQLVDMNDTDLRMGGCITGMVSRHDMEEMVRHNHNQLQYWFSGVQPKFIVKKGGDFDLDFTILDDQFEQARKAGIKSNVYFLGGNPYGFPSTQTLPRELARQVLGMTMDEYKALMLKDPYNVPEQLVPLYKKWVAKVMQHAKEKNWPEQILTPFDEPAKWVQSREGTGKWIRPQFEQCCQFIHEAWPATRIYGSIHHAKPGIVFLKDIDVFCTNAVGEDATLGDQVREGKKVFWQYSGTSASSPADRARFTFGFYFHSFNSRGSLCWAYNWFTDRFDNTQGDNWGYGWYSPTDVIPAPYYEGMREAWDDRRYIETLRKVGKEKGVEVETFLNEIGQTARASRGKGGEDTVNDFWDQAKQVGVMDELRQRVAARILEISEKAPATQPMQRSS